jgi:mRNA interferase HicA
VLVRRADKHDWYRNSASGISQPVPRHREIKDGLARHIIKMLSNLADGSSGSESPENSST